MNTELDQLAAVAAEADAAAVPPEPIDPNAPPAPPPVDFSGEARGAVDMFAAMVVGYAPAAEPLWNDGAKSRISAALAPVMEKYGFSFGTLPPELTLMIVAGPVLYQSARIIATQMNAEKVKAAKAPEKSAGVTQAGEGAAASPPASSPEQLTHPQTALYPVM